MAGTRGSNTMAEQLRGVLTQIAEMKAAPDADIAYLTMLETEVLKYLRAPFEKQRQEQQLGSQSAMGQPPGPTEQLLLGNAAQGGGQGSIAQLLGLGGGGGQQRVPGVMQGASMPPGDELRRLMSQTAL